MSAKKTTRRIWVEWDTEVDKVRRSPEALGLPGELVVPHDVADEDVGDWASEATGWCVAAWGWK